MQKRIEDKLYVFDLVPFEITDGTDAEVIYVQYEHVAGYKKLNAELADKITGFNQFIMTVNPPVWAQAEPEPGPEPEPQGHTLTFSTNDSSKFTMTINGDSYNPSDGNWANIMENYVIRIYPADNMSKYDDQSNLTVDNDDPFGTCWVATMPDNDYTITINYIGGGESGESA